MKIIYGDNESINRLIENGMDKLKGLIDSSTVIGDKVETGDGTVIIPISRVTVGYVVGGGEYADLSLKRFRSNYPMAGGSSGGMSVSPMGFLIEKDGEVSFVNIEDKSLYQTVLNTINSIMKKIGKEKKSEK